MGSAVQLDRCYAGLTSAIHDAIRKHQTTVIGFEAQGGPFQLHITYQKQTPTIHGPRPAYAYQKHGDVPRYDHPSAVEVVEHAVDPQTIRWIKETDLQYRYPTDRSGITSQMHIMHALISHLRIEKTFSHPLYTMPMPARIRKQGRLTLSNFLGEPFQAQITISGSPQLTHTRPLPLMFAQNTWTLTHVDIEDVRITRPSIPFARCFDEAFVGDLIKAVGSSRE
jgi:hypothetical protein